MEFTANDFTKINEVIHKESSKENKRSKALSHMDKSFSRVAQPNVNDNSKSNKRLKPQSTLAHKTQTRLNARRNAEIDDFLISLLMEDIIDEAFWKFHTKCVYTLGLECYNQLLVEARSGRNPKHLFAFKLKGALELHFKKQIYRDKYEL
jgi:hypothetical protein